jgi:hypothetical protein
MRKNFMAGIIGLALICGMVLAGCDNSAGGGNGGGGPKIETKLFVSGIDGSIQFYTNDTAECNKTYMSGVQNNTSTGAPNVYQMEVKKVSGYHGMLYGMTFGAPDMANFYFFGISANGGYYVGKRVASTLSAIQGWTDSTEITTGYNAANTLKTELKDSTFELSINDTVVYTINPLDASIDSGTKIGCITSIGTAAYESFPDVPMDVRFKIK